MAYIFQLLYRETNFGRTGVENYFNEIQKAHDSLCRGLDFGDAGNLEWANTWTHPFEWLKEYML